MQTSLFDFELPQDLIAQHPLAERDGARMLRVADDLQDSRVRGLLSFLKPGDVMVFNDTRVIPARLFGVRGAARVEVLLHKKLSSVIARNEVTKQSSTGSPRFARDDKEIWQCFAKPAKKLKPGDKIAFADDFSAVVIEKTPDGQVLLEFDANSMPEKLKQYGHMPLPPYMNREDAAADREAYQTVYAAHDGSVAAPTAGLHFTPGLLKAIDAMGVARAHVTLHVGGGTFLPVKAEDTKDHVMHSEWAEISKEAAAAINAAKASGGCVIAVGTTSLRTLESASENGIVKPFSGETNIFITPGYKFKLVDILLTNFHLPKSTLFMLVSAFCGLERMKAAYAHAIMNRYRFYSYGDACLLYKAAS